MSYVAHVYQGVARHLRAAWQRPQGQRLQYLREMLTIVSDMVEKRDLFRGDRSAFYGELVSQANQRAARRYAPKPYRGSLVLILSRRLLSSSGDDQRLRWKDFAEGGIRVARVDGTDSGSLLTPDYVHGFTRALQAAVALSLPVGEDSGQTWDV